LDVAFLRLERWPIGAKPLVPAKDTKLVGNGNRCYIIGHPLRRNGCFKMFSLQQDNVMGSTVEKTFLNYFTSTLPGNSGSPVLAWDDRTRAVVVVAVHHSGEAFQKDYHGHVGKNQGTLFSRIWEEMKKMAPSVLSK